jgi:hypothetical protein
MHNQNDGNVVRLKTPVLVCTALLLAAIGLQATPVCPSMGTYATLESLGSCTIGDKTFSGFTFSNSAVGAIPLDATALQYTTIDSGTAAIGFQFGVALTAGPGQTNDLGIGYTVYGSDIDDAQVTMAGLAVGTGSFATIGETVCPGSPIATCLSSLSLSTFVYPVNPPPNRTSDSVTFGPVDTLGVLKDINVIGGATGFASISLFSDTVSQGVIPEPGFYGVLAGGLAGIFLFARRRRKTA